MLCVNSDNFPPVAVLASNLEPFIDHIANFVPPTPASDATMDPVVISLKREVLATQVVVDERTS